MKRAASGTEGKAVGTTDTAGMNALLLAAGYATRLYPLTIDTPKPLLDVAGKPIAQYMVDQLAAVDQVGRLLVVTNHRFAGHLSRWAAGAPSRFAIEVVDDQTETNETRLGAIGDIAFTLERFPELRERPLFVLGGDNLVDFRLGDMVADFAARGGAATVICLVHTVDPAQLRRSGVVTLDTEHRVVGFVEKPSKPPSDLTCPPFYVFPPAALALIPDYLAAGQSPDAPGNFMAWLHTRAPVYGHVFAEDRYDIGTPESYAAARRLFERRKAPPLA
jgi:glucose-1-phosphate thymidylyltransferase